MPTSLKIFIIVAAIALSIPLGVLYLNGRSTDDFYGCQRVFQTDKMVYRPGDTIKLSVLVIPEKEKTIKVYDNFENLEIDMAFHRPCDLANPSSGDCAFKNGILFEEKPRKPTVGHKTYSISPENPYKHTFYGILNYDIETDQYTISFPDYGYSSRFKRSEYEKSASLGFHGQWYPIKPELTASLEEFIEYKPIELQANAHYTHQQD